MEAILSLNTEGRTKLVINDNERDELLKKAKLAGISLPVRGDGVIIESSYQIGLSNGRNGRKRKEALEALSESLRKQGVGVELILSSNEKDKGPKYKNTHGRFR